MEAGRENALAMARYLFFYSRLRYSLEQLIKPRSCPEIRTLANPARPTSSGSGRLTPTLTGTARPITSRSGAPTRHLVLAYRPSWQSLEDLSAIAARVREICPEIGTFILPATQANGVSRRDAAERPTLVVSTGAMTGFRPLRGKIYQGFPIPKFQQLSRLRAAGVPIPSTARLTPDLRLDPGVWGEFVVLKPTEMTTSSYGHGINLFRSRRVRFIPPQEYPVGHPGRLGPMLVQQYIDTGERLAVYRVLTFFGEPLYAMLIRSIVPRVDLSAPDPIIERAIIAHQADKDRDRQLVNDPDVIALARSAYTAIPEIPLQGCDIIRAAGTGRLFVLELNPGGNTWHFSSRHGADMRLRMGPEAVRQMHEQFRAFETAAATLARRTLNEAE